MLEASSLTRATGSIVDITAEFVLFDNSLLVGWYGCNGIDWLARLFHLQILAGASTDDGLDWGVKRFRNGRSLRRHADRLFSVSNSISALPSNAE